MALLFDLLSPQWQVHLASLREDIDLIDDKLKNQNGYLPARSAIFRALSDKCQSRVLIVGQDPYPNPAYAMGLSFSIPESESPLPASLRNIFKELHSDMGEPLRSNGDLSDWQQQGVVLLNRALTVSAHVRDSHAHLGWQRITDRIVEVLAEQGVIAVLWGKSAEELAPYFSESDRFLSAHPSPLSAYRGFFGSKPFSQVNSRLLDLGKAPIRWG